MKKPWWITSGILAAGACLGLTIFYAAPAWAPPGSATPAAAAPSPAAAAPTAVPVHAAPAAVASTGAPLSMPIAADSEPTMVPDASSPAGGTDSGPTEPAPILGGGYVGSAKCAQCHEEIYQRFKANSRKSRAFDSVKRMKGLTDEERKGCYRCHTTGYGKPTGFTDFQKTPYLADVGCEACHGPGKLHTQSMDMAHIVRKVTIDVCQKCHDDSKVKSFRYKGVIYAGAH